MREVFDNWDDCIMRSMDVSGVVNRIMCLYLIGSASQRDCR